MTRLTPNNRRVLWIDQMLTWCHDCETGREKLIDLLADARHWCDRHGESFAELDRIAHVHYLHELFQPKGDRS